MKQERKTERQKMKKQNKRLVAQPKGEGKCHSLTPLHLAHAWEMRPLPPRREKNILLHLAHAWEMRHSGTRRYEARRKVAPRARVGDASKWTIATLFIIALHLAHAWEMRLNCIV